MSHSSSTTAAVSDGGWRILLTGVTSIHGWPVYRLLQRHFTPDNLFAVRPPKMRVPSGCNVLSTCVTDIAALMRIRDDFCPTHVIHGSGVCDLDVCEERPAWARALNTQGAANVAQVFGGTCYVLYLSSDLVFSGANAPELGYNEAHPIDPISVVGRTIADAEEHIRQCLRHCIVRLGLPLGASITGNKGALDWIASRLRRNLRVTLFTDEWRSCIECTELAESVLMLLRAEARGVFHCGGPRPWSLHDVGLKVVRDGEFPPQLLKGVLRCEEKNGPPRVGNISLDSSKLQKYRHLAQRSYTEWSDSTGP